MVWFAATWLWDRKCSLMPESVKESTKTHLYFYDVIVALSFNGDVTATFGVPIWECSNNPHLFDSKKARMRKPHVSIARLVKFFVDDFPLEFWEIDHLSACNY
jgi:hypothetical protein